jgi:AmmeMemoRadiSam system protein B
MGDQKEGYIDELAKKLAEIYDEKTLIVASSDLSHYYPASYADKLDARVETRINNFDYEGLYKDIQRKLSEACGAGPMVAMLKALKSVGKENAEVLVRTNSGNVSQDYSEVVGYLSAIVY